MNKLEQAVIFQRLFSEFMSETGYETKTTFYQDFSIADVFGVFAILETYSTAFKDWKHDVVYVTELTIVLNHKIWEHHEKRPEIAIIYDQLWRELDTWCMDNLNGADLEYFYKITN